MRSIMLSVLAAISFLLAGCGGIASQPTGQRLGGAVAPPSNHYTAAYFRSHYVHPGITLHGSPRPQAPHASAPHALPSTASIDLPVYPATGDQGPLGECAAWASAWALSFQYRLQVSHDQTLFSPRALYDHYADTYQNGQDNGSWPDGDLERVPVDGVPTFAQFPEPPYVIDNPIPQTAADGSNLAADAAQYRLPVVMHDLIGAQGTGYALVDRIKATIAAGHPVLWAFPVFSTYDRATQQPLIVPPTQAELDRSPNGRGGHENVLLAYDDNKQMPDGTKGAALTANQWGTGWGINGRAWVSYSFLAQFIYGAEYLTLNLPDPTPTPQPTASPVSTVTPLPTSTPTATATAVPTATVTPTPTPRPVHHRYHRTPPRFGGPIPSFDWRNE